MMNIKRKYDLWSHAYLQQFKHSNLKVFANHLQHMKRFLNILILKKREDNCMKNDQNNGQIIIKTDPPGLEKAASFYLFISRTFWLIVN